MHTTFYSVPGTKHLITQVPEIQRVARLLAGVDPPPEDQTSKLNQSTRVVNIDVYYTIRPFKKILVQKLTERRTQVPEMRRVARLLAGVDPSEAGSSGKPPSLKVCPNSNQIHLR